MKTIDNKISDLEYEIGLLGTKIIFSEEESKKFQQAKEAGTLPDGIFPEKSFSAEESHRYCQYEHPLSKEEREQVRYLLLLKQTKSLRAMKNYLRTIKNCAVWGIILLVFLLLKF